MLRYTLYEIFMTGFSNPSAQEPSANDELKVLQGANDHTRG